MNQAMGGPPVELFALVFLFGGGLVIAVIFTWIISGIGRAQESTEDQSNNASPDRSAQRRRPRRNGPEVDDDAKPIQFHTNARDRRHPKGSGRNGS